ncbi:hypothetical protein LINPERHAP2_LOCUS24500 [Linum perenne]
MIILLLSLFSIGDCVTDNATLLNPNDILKTIKSEDGDVVDCVDILKQPALRHPLLADHTLQHAQVTLTGENYYGGTAKFNVWTPVTIAPDLSLAQMWVLTGDGPDLNSVEAGWMSDGYRSTGCYNLECPGFVQISSKVAPGFRVAPVSTYGGKQFDISINIQKDMTSGNWWLRVQGEDVGYWPSNLFHGGGLSTYSTAINWGGEITNKNPHGFHTQTDMGSGHFASEGITKAAFIKNIGYVDQVGNVKDAHDLIPYATRANCYSVEVQDWDANYGVYIFYGGPGYSPSCKT